MTRSPAEGPRRTRRVGLLAMLVALLSGGLSAGTARAAQESPLTEGRILRVESQFGRGSGTTVRVDAFQTPSGERLVIVSGLLRWCDEKNDDLVLRRLR